MPLLDRSKYGGPRRKRQAEVTSARALAVLPLQQQCYMLRVTENITFREIAERLSGGVGSTLSEAQARDLCLREAKVRGRVPDAEIKEQMIEQLDRVVNRGMQIAMNDSARDRVAALNTVIAAQARLSALLGSDAPRQTEIKDTTPRDIPPPTEQDVLAQLAEEGRADLAKRGLVYDPETGLERPISEADGPPVVA